MIKGRFDIMSGRPMIDCYVDVKTLGISGGVQFLVDTGADVTVLMPGDAASLGVDQDQLKHCQTVESTGVGGCCEDYLVPGIIIVDDEDAAKAYRIGLRIAKESPDLHGLPSLLGRDILQHWRLLCDMRNNRLEIEVLMSDGEYE